MTLTAALLGFAPLAAVMTLTPGADMTLVLRTAARRGPRAALLAGLGVCAGALAWGLAAAVGVAALLRAAPWLYRGLAYAGAAYLAYLGIRLLWPSGGDGHGRAARGGAFVQGLTTNLLNPKIGVFYVSLIPQFPVPGVSAALVGASLAGLHGVMGMTLFGVIAAAASRASELLRRPRVARALDVTCGVFLLAFATLVVWRV